jgi:hypothetical protein
MEQHNIPTVPFLTGHTLLLQLYDINLQEEDYIDNAWLILNNEIGNRAKHPFKAILTVDENLTVPIPCNAELITSVTNVTVGDNSMGNLESLTVVNNIDYPQYFSNFYGFSIYRREFLESRTLNRDPYKPEGVYIDYEITEDGYLLFHDTRLQGTTIHIYYKGIILDDDGLPQINEREAGALAARTAYYHIQKNAFRGVKEAMELLPYIKKDSARLVLRAKTAMYVSEQDIDKILDVQTSHNRKVYGRKFTYRR